LTNAGRHQRQALRIRNRGNTGEQMNGWDWRVVLERAGSGRHKTNPVL